MSIAEIISISIYLGGALILALSLGLALGLAMETETRYGKYLLPMVMPVIGLGVALSTVLTGRSLSFVDFDPTGKSIGVQYITEGNPYAATWPLRFATLYILAASFALVFAYFYRRDAKPAQGRFLMLAFAVFFLTNVITPAIFGTKPAFVFNHYYPLIVFLAAFATRTHDPARLVLFGKLTLFALLAGSLALIAIRPDLVMQRPYVYGWVPGMNFRLWGLASHANSIGPLALLYLLLAIHQPFRQRWLQWLGLAVAIGVLVLAQSKTAWVATFFLLAVLAVYHAAPKFQAAWSTGRTDYQVVGIAIAAILAALGLLVFIIAVDVGPYWNKFANSPAGGQMFDLTGRGAIWDVAIEVWQQNPLFGYGPKLWDPEFRKSIGMSFAFSAHNQFMQSLSGAGIIGVVGLVVYLGVVLRYAIALAQATQGFSLALGLFLLIRCMTETPISTGTLFNGELLTHLLVFGFLIRQSIQCANSWAASSSNCRLAPHMKPAT